MCLALQTMNNLPEEIEQEIVQMARISARADLALDVYNLPKRIPCCAAFGRWRKRRCNRPSRLGGIMCYHHASLANSEVWKDPNEKLIADPIFVFKSLL